jgi:hypothetical protein
MASVKPKEKNVLSACFYKKKILFVNNILILRMELERLLLMASNMAKRWGRDSEVKI